MKKIDLGKAKLMIDLFSPDRWKDSQHDAILHLVFKPFTKQAGGFKTYPLAYLSL